MITKTIEIVEIFDNMGIPNYPFSELKYYIPGHLINLHRNSIHISISHTGHSIDFMFGPTEGISRIKHLIKKGLDP